MFVLSWWIPSINYLFCGLQLLQSEHLHGVLHETKWPQCKPWISRLCLCNRFKERNSGGIDICWRTSVHENWCQRLHVPGMHYNEVRTTSIIQTSKNEQCRLLLHLFLPGICVSCGSSNYGSCPWTWVCSDICSGHWNCSEVVPSRY